MTKNFITLAACACLARPVLAWNAEGHMLIAQIAYNHLDSDVKAKCDALIAVPLTYSSSSSSNFVTAACWADDFKSQLGTGTSHYIDLPFSLDGYPTNGVPPGVPNVVTAINQYIATLQNTTSSLTDQATALRYLIHYVGDIEQPLHCSNAISTNHPTGDAGGNSFSIKGQWSNLHSLWDSGGGYLTDSVSRPLSAAGVATITNKVAAIEADYPYPLSVGSIPDPMTWAVEGWGLAQTVSYVGITNGGTPSTAYLNTAMATTEQRMAIGGQRLAKLLETIYETNAPTLTSVTFTNPNFDLSWNTVTGRSYRVQWKQDMTDTNWTDLTDLTATNNPISFTESPAQPQRFYRVILVN